MCYPWHVLTPRPTDRPGHPPRTIFFEGMLIGGIFRLATVLADVEHFLLVTRRQADICLSVMLGWEPLGDVLVDRPS